MKTIKYLIILLLTIINFTIQAQSSIEPKSVLIGVDKFPDGTLFQPLFMYTQENLEGALRAGWITDKSWNADSLGFGTIGVGYDAKASGAYSASFGFKTNASGESSLAQGNRTKAYGDYSMAGGRKSGSNSNYSFAFGRECQTGIVSAPSFSEFSIAMGDSAYTLGLASLAIGKNVTAFNDYSQAFGYRNLTNSKYSTTFGYHTETVTDHMFVVGKHNLPLGPAIPSGDTHLFVVGNGTSLAARRNAFVVTNYGNVGIGVSYPQEDLEVAGNICYSGVVTCSSDIRFKKDISILPKALDALKSIRPVYYNLRKDEFPEKDFSNQRQIGFIAQEIQSQYPEIVLEDAEGYLSVDYSKMTPILLKAIQELTERVETLEKQLANQKTK